MLVSCLLGTRTRSPVRYPPCLGPLYPTYSCPTPNRFYLLPAPLLPTISPTGHQRALAELPHLILDPSSPGSTLSRHSCSTTMSTTPEILNTNISGPYNSLLAKALLSQQSRPLPNRNASWFNNNDPKLCYSHWCRPPPQNPSFYSQREESTVQAVVRSRNDTSRRK